MIRSKNVARGKLGVAVNWVRRLLLESVYYRICKSSWLHSCNMQCLIFSSLATMFPETVNWISSSDEYVTSNYLSHFILM